MKNLPNIKILDESDKRLHQKSEEVTFPLDKETIKTIYDCLDYLEMSQDEEMAENRWYCSLRSDWHLRIAFVVWCIFGFEIYCRAMQYFSCGRENVFEDRFFISCSLV